MRAALVLIGFTAVIAQIVLMRELIVVFYGNEVSLGLMLAVWLLWTAFGSGVLGRLFTTARGSRRVVAGLEALVAAAFPLTIFAVRASRRLFQAVPGEMLGPVPMFLTALVALSLFCALSGWLFAAGSRLYATETGASTAGATGSVYLLEAIGSGAGGLLAGLVLIRYLDAFDIAALVGSLNLLAAAALALPARYYAVAGAALVLFPFAAHRLEAISLAQLWHGFQLVETRNSVYGNLAVTRTEDNLTVFENGLAVFHVPDPDAAEEAVHYALLEHPAPRNVLLIGGGVNGSLAQALQHPAIERLDYVELDPAILELARRHFPLHADSRVHIHNMDGRLFVKTTPRTFDVIIVNLPDPQTAQLNRFYTLEFFREAARRLKPSGVFSFGLSASENYISPELADFLRCINRTLREVFPDVVMIPGDTVHFFAATRPGILVSDAAGLLARLRKNS
ncbi:MAG: fused MFS/spermidine synthase, partial [Acidobacteria bacterium]|nr:fused MFS/spermidine synthase [Acidobacteriota bacterium]